MHLRKVHLHEFFSHPIKGMHFRRFEIKIQGASRAHVCLMHPRLWGRKAEACDDVSVSPQPKQNINLQGARAESFMGRVRAVVT